MHAQDEPFPAPRLSKEPTKQSTPGPLRVREPPARPPPSAGRLCLCGLKRRRGSTCASSAHTCAWPPPGARGWQGGLALQLPPPPPPRAPPGPACRPPRGSARPGPGMVGAAGSGGRAGGRAAGRGRGGEGLVPGIWLRRLRGGSQGLWTAAEGED